MSALAIGLLVFSAVAILVAFTLLGFAIGLAWSGRTARQIQDDADTLAKTVVSADTLRVALPNQDRRPRRMRDGEPWNRPGTWTENTARVEMPYNRARTPMDDTQPMDRIIP